MRRYSDEVLCGCLIILLGIIIIGMASLISRFDRNNVEAAITPIVTPTISQPTTDISNRLPVGMSIVSMIPILKNLGATERVTVYVVVKLSSNFTTEDGEVAISKLRKQIESIPGTNAVIIVTQGGSI
jgi:hypothetical protein